MKAIIQSKIHSTTGLIFTRIFSYAQVETRWLRSCRKTILTKLLLYASIALVLIPVQQATAVETQNAYVKVVNDTGKEIAYVIVLHKYSNVYKETLRWPETGISIIESGDETEPKVVRYNTGVLTTGRDWWMVIWGHNGDERIYYTDPLNARGFIDGLELVGQWGIPAVATAVGAAIGAACTAGSGGACAPAGAAATAAALGGGTAIAEIMMNNESTVGFKQHILEDDDANQITTITLKSFAPKKNIRTVGDVLFSSKSGNSETRYKRKASIDLPDELKKSITMEIDCFNKVQGTVPWSRDSSQKHWTPSNVVKLCQGTTNPVATIRCFETGIQHHGEWRRATRECSGSSSSNSGQSTTTTAMGISSKALNELAMRVESDDGANEFIGTYQSILGNLTATSGYHLLTPLFRGKTNDKDEQSIVTLMKALKSTEVAEIAMAGRRLEEFDDEVDGEEWDELEPVLRKVPEMMQ